MASRATAANSGVPAKATLMISVFLEVGETGAEPVASSPSLASHLPTGAQPHLGYGEHRIRRIRSHRRLMRRLQAVMRAFLASLALMRLCLSRDKYSTKTLPSR